MKNATVKSHLVGNLHDIPICGQSNNVAGFIHYVNLTEAAAKLVIDLQPSCRTAWFRNFVTVPRTYQLPECPRSQQPGESSVRITPAGTLEPLKNSPLAPYMKPTLAHVLNMMGQQLLDVVMWRHLEKFSCSVEVGTELRSFEQSNEVITAILVKNAVSETFDTKWMNGADGAKGIVRKQPWLMFWVGIRTLEVLGDGIMPNPDSDVWCNK
ncbi:hypothetical protein BDR05DRAFT_994962 [Suillus weaverae]|nr:hypothetical protein BDR05DRAFT_994962 [Suillus weaverae]